MPDAAVPCPLCRLLNPPRAVKCDCGYRFDTGERPDRSAPTSKPPEPPAVGVALSMCVGVLAAGGAAYLWRLARFQGLAHVMVAYVGSIMVHALIGHWFRLHQTGYGLGTFGGFVFTGLAIFAYAIWFAESETAGIFGLMIGVLVGVMGASFVGFSALLNRLLRQRQP